MSDVIVIGGITVDIEGHPHNRLIYQDSNPGKINIAYGGVGRNIAENLARLKIQVSFHSLVGDDMPGRNAVRDLSVLGVKTDGVELLQGENTAMYISILNSVGDMELAICNMDILEKISEYMIDRAALSARNTGIIAMDTNLTEDVLNYAIKRFEGTPLFLDPVSTAKAERVKKIIGKFHTIKPNRAEAEVLTGISIIEPDSLQKAGRWFIQQGVKRVFITLSSGGVYYMDKEVSGIMKPKKVLNGDGSATGAGDAFSAGVIYSFIQGFDMITAARYGMAAASLALESETAVNPMMNIEEVRRRAL